MSKSYCFNIQGYKIPAKYDKNHDRKLQKSEFNVWLNDNNFEYVNKTILPKRNVSGKNSLPTYIPLYKEVFDGEIGVAKQSNKTGDCWLLSGVNALASTSWGRKIIKESIKPDGFGGVTVTFKDKTLKKNEYYISAYEIEQARKSGEYTCGDADMLAIELATEKCFDKLIKDGKIYHDTFYDDRYGAKSIAGSPSKLPNYEFYMVEELLTGVKPIEIYDCGVNLFNNNFDKSLLKEIAENKDDYSVQVCFESMSDMLEIRPNREKFHGSHAYMIKNINYGKDVTLSDPYFPDKTFTISFDRFLEEVSIMTVLPNPNKKTNIENYRIDSYKKIYGSSRREEELSCIEKRKSLQAEQEIKAKSRAKEREKIKNEVLKFEYESFLSNALNTWSCDEAKKFKINKNNVLKIFEKYDDFLYFSLERAGRTSDKNVKKYITEPVIKALADIARDYNIDNTIIKSYVDNCNKYMNNFICFNRGEKVADEIMRMYKLIQQQQSK